jgi:hypothetical protein
VRGGAGGVDAHDLGPRVRRQVQRAEQHAVAAQVGDVGPRAQGQLRAAEAGRARADAAVGLGLGHRLAAPSSGQELDRVDDLGVAGAPAQVDVDGLGDLVARRIRRLIEQVLGPDHDAGDAEAALQAGRGHEGVGHLLTLGLGHALEGDDVLARGLGHRHRAGRDRAPADQRQTAAALPLRRAAVLHRAHAAALAQGLEQRLVAAGARPRSVGR